MASKLNIEMLLKINGGLMVKVSVSQPIDQLTYLVQDHICSYDASTGWFQEADSKVIDICCNILLSNRA
jgi:hypothetical protein